MNLKAEYIVLSSYVQGMGVVSGLKFWIGSSIIWDIKEFVYLNITHRPHCSEHGWDCDGTCEFEKFFYRQDILDHFARNKAELHHIEEGPNGECVYCGEEPGTRLIPNPDWSKIDRWRVCEVCDEVIKLQLGMSFKEMTGRSAKEELEALDKIAKRTGKPIFCGGIMRTEEDKYETFGVEFTGET